MKTIFLLSLIANIAFASGVVVRSQDSESQSFSEYLKRSSQYRSYIDHILDSGEALPTLPLDETLESVEKNLKLIENKIWRASDVEAIVALNIAGAQRSSGFKKQKFLDRLDALFSLYPEQQQIFFEFWSGFSATVSSAKNLREDLTAFLSTLSRQSDKDDAKLLIDGRLATVAMLGQVKDYEHQWVFLSNVYEPLIVVGSYTSFVSQLSKLQPLAQGHCEELSRSSSKLQAPYEVFFSKQCVYSPDENQELIADMKPELKSEKSEKWLWPLGFVIGAGLIYGLKDKKIVFKLPGFAWP